MEDKLKASLAFFIFIVLAVSFTTVVANNQVAVTTLSNFVNTTVTITSGHGQLARTSGVESIQFFGNGTINTYLSTVSIGTHVNVTSGGNITVARGLNQTSGALTAFNESFANGVYNVSYTYRGDNYVANSTARTLVGFNTLWFAIFIVFVAIAFAYKTYPELFNN